MAEAAHNSGYADYYKLRWAVWNSSEPTAVKVLALAILEHMRPDKLDAYPSRTRLATMCSISENTLERHWDSISKWIDIVKERGKRNVYRARIYACASELIEMMPDKLPPKMVGASEQNHPPKWVVPKMGGPQNGGSTTPQNGGSEDLKNNRDIKSNSTRTRDEHDRMEKLLREAAAESLNSTSPTLFVLADLWRWLEAGCDLELDILPAIRGAAQAKPKRSVRAWGYFTGAVFAARDKRLAPAPDVQAPLPNGHGDWHDKRREHERKSHEAAKRILGG